MQIVIQIKQLNTQCYQIVFINVANLVLVLETKTERSQRRSTNNFCKMFIKITYKKSEHIKRKYLQKYSFDPFPKIWKNCGLYRDSPLRVVSIFVCTHEDWFKISWPTWLKLSVTFNLGLLFYSGCVFLETQF